MVRSFRSVLGRQKLLLLKLKALRCGIWFRLLSRLDRGLVDLTIKVADEVRSLRLTEALTAVMKKVEDALQNGISHATYRIGFPLASKLGSLAKKWGHPSAENWVCDTSFARFLAIIHLNDKQSMKIGIPEFSA